MIEFGKWFFVGYLSVFEISTTSKVTTGKKSLELGAFEFCDQAVHDRCQQVGVRNGQDIFSTFQFSLPTSKNIKSYKKIINY